MRQLIHIGKKAFDPTRKLVETILKDQKQVHIYIRKATSEDVIGDTDDSPDNYIVIHDGGINNSEYFYIVIKCFICFLVGLLIASI